MIAKQCLFRDEEENLCQGIQVETADNKWFIICACCGSIFEQEDVHDVQVFNDWANFSNCIFQLY